VKKRCLFRWTLILAGVGILFLTLFFFDSVCAQGEFVTEVRIPSRFSPVGSGARALGMGSAFIAVADDATAASWNPGGLIQLDRPEISVVGDYVYRTDDLDFGNNPEANGSQNVSETKLNYLSVAYPFILFNRNMIISLNYQRRFDFDLDWESTRSFSDPLITETQRIKNRQEGEIYALGIAYSIKIFPKLSFGFTLNFWEDFLQDNKWEIKTVQNSSSVFKSPDGSQESFSEEIIQDEEFKFSGFNFNLGILWNATDKLNFGVVFKSPFTADLEVQTTRSEESDFSQETSFQKENKDLDMPMSYGVGAAYRFSDQFLISADFTRTHWDDFLLKNGDEISPITSRPKNESDIDPTNAIRLGGEYIFIKPKYVIPLRAGVFYDPAPARNSPDDFFGFSIGTGIGMNRFSLDAAYQYRFGRDVGGSILTGSDLSVDVDEHSFFTSLIFYF
jgi:long-subunit fatty acid transport protein